MFEIIGREDRFQMAVLQALQRLLQLDEQRPRALPVQPHHIINHGGVQLGNFTYLHIDNLLVLPSNKFQWLSGAMEFWEFRSN